MSKYLICASYTTEGIKGLHKEGGTGRREAIEKMLADVGGRLDAFYFAFGDDDVYVLAEMPDNVSAAAIGLAVGSSGAVKTKTTVLLTPEEIDRAAHTTIGYRAPGT